MPEREKRYKDGLWGKDAKELAKENIETGWIRRSGK